MPERNALLLVIVLALSACAPEKAAETKAPAEPEKPPEAYRVRFDTTKGPFTAEITRAWAPRGADHFFELVQSRYYDGAPFYRVIRGFVAQFGIHRDADTNRLWSQLRIPDDPVKQSNKRGFVSFAQSGPGSRTTQVFVNLRDNSVLDKSGFAPFGQVVEGMEVLDGLYAYGELAPRGAGPDPAKMDAQGIQYLETRFPRLDRIERARIVPAK